jgi:L-amino acid N-acyltransferase YncA
MAASGSGVRPASVQDAAACLAIYRPCVQTTAISWEIDVPSVGEMAARIGGLSPIHEWLVLEQPLAAFQIFQCSAETGIYVDVRHHRAGGGRELYTQLLRRLTERGYNPTRPATLNPTRRATAFIDPSGSTRTPAYTDAPHGSATAGTTWPGCNSICWALLIRMDRPARFADRRPAPSGPLRNRQGAMSARTGFAKVNRGRVVHLQCTFTPESTLRHP